MFLKFWEKRSEDAGNRAKKLPGPKSIPETVGRYLIVELKQDPDVVWNLKAVVRRHSEDKDVFDFRIYSERQVSSKRVSIKDYTSLDMAQELILFEGWYHKKNNKVHIEEKIKPLAEKAA